MDALFLIAVTLLGCGALPLAIWAERREERRFFEKYGRWPTEDDYMGAGE